VSSLSGTLLEGSVEAIPHRIFVVYGGVLQQVDALDDTERGKGGFGSTGVEHKS